MSLEVAPNPVPKGPGPGSVRVTWDFGDGGGGEVRVSRDGGPETVFAAGSRGSEEASWIAPGATYEFRLYRRRRTRPVASVQVSMEGTPSVATRSSLRSGRGGPFLRASPNPVAPGATAGTTRLSWDTGDGSNGLLTVATRRSTRRADEALVASGPSGDQEINWIKRDLVYRFHLYRNSTDGKPIATTRVTMRYERLEILADLAVLAAVVLPPVLLAVFSAYAARRLLRAFRFRNS